MLTHVPLLHTMADFYRLPHQADIRFPAYLALLRDGDAHAIPPLNGYNPLAKTHVSAYLDMLIAHDIDTQSSTWVREAALELDASCATSMHGYTVADDVAGGWTERSAVEMATRYHPNYALKRQWICTTLFVSDQLDSPAVHQQCRASIYRSWWITRYGEPQTLHDIIRLEHAVARFAGVQYTLDGDDVAYTAHIIQPYLAAREYATHVAVLFGDVVARSNGFPPLGFSAHAGLAYAASSLAQ